MTKPTVLMDMDGVIADFDEQFFTRAIESGWSFDIEHRSHQVSRWLTDHMPHKHEKKQAWKMLGSGGWFRNLPVIEGSKQGMYELDKLADIWICTKPLDSDPTCLQDKRDWVAQHFPKFKNKLIITPDKSLIKGAVLLDDAPKMHWLETAEWKPLIYSHPFNSHADSPLYEYPHYDWSQPVDKIVEYAMENNI